VDGRFPGLDGLRGVLALSVFVHHAAYFTNYFQRGEWTLDHRSLSYMVGSVSVSVFFMITGFLFWSKALRARGRLDILPLYASRVRRIYPMFLFSFLLILTITAVRTDGRFREPPLRVLGQVGRWLLGGLAGFPAINDCHPWQLNNAGVTWTLQWESWFYLLLPALAFLIWKPWRFAAAGVLLLGGLALPALRSTVNFPNVACFALGCLAAYLLAKVRPSPRVPAVLSAAVIALPAGLCWGAGHLPSFSWRFLAFPILVAVLYGATGLGMLVSKAWRLLGTISYSVYLLHGTVLYVFLGLVDRGMPLRNVSGLGMLGLLSGCAVLLVLLSSLTYRYIEHPFMTPPAGARIPLPAPPTPVVRPAEV
jgi:peptidoglycan/LPS O-acetylase OafA/YrhL